MYTYECARENSGDISFEIDWQIVFIAFLEQTYFGQIENTYLCVIKLSVNTKQIRTGKETFQLFQMDKLGYEARVFTCS